MFLTDLFCSFEIIFTCFLLLWDNAEPSCAASGAVSWICFTKPCNTSPSSCPAAGCPLSQQEAPSSFTQCSNLTWHSSPAPSTVPKQTPTSAHWHLQQLLAHLLNRFPSPPCVRSQTLLMTDQAAPFPLKGPATDLIFCRQLLQKRGRSRQRVWAGKVNGRCYGGNMLWTGISIRAVC